MLRNLLVLFAVFQAWASFGCGDNDRSPGTIADHIRADGRFSTLEGVLRDTDMLETLDGVGPYTLFAFTNEGLNLDDVPEDRMRGLVEYHIHEGALSTTELLGRTAASTLEGTEIHIRNGLSGLLLNDGVVVEPTPINATNGVIHLIDRALVRTLVASTVEFESTPDLLIDGVASDSITIDRGGFLHDLRVLVDVQQQDVSNTFVMLRHVDTGALVRLIERPRSRLSNLTLTLADSAVLDSVVDVESGRDPTAEAFPAAEYRAVEPLEYLVGESVSGEWQLTVFNFGRDAEDGESRLKSWGMLATIGEEMPAPALVLNPRGTVPGAFGQRFVESAVVEAKRVGGLQGDLEFVGNVGEIEAATVTVGEEERIGALLFPIPETAEPGPRTVTVAARISGVSRAALFASSIAAPQSDGVELLAQIPLPNLGAVGENGNDIWGWTDPANGSEIAIMGTSINTAFVDVSVPASPVVLGFLPTASESSLWRDIKVYQNHAFIVSEAEDHGMQVFDLTQLRDVSEIQSFTETAHADDFGNAHNIFINEDSGLAYVVGSDFEGCDGGILVYDISSPTSPVAISCFSGGVTNGQIGGPSYPTDVYTHDIQCVVYHGPDADYQGRELCFSADEESIAIADFTDPANPSQIVRMTYESSGYTHQGWLTEDHEYFLLNDEFDELSLGVATRSYVWDMRDLDAPKLSSFIDNPSAAIGHNTYIANDIAYQANYTSGLRLVDLGDIANGNSHEVAYYDTNPDDDAICEVVDKCGVPSFDGAWSNYPFFDSGTIIVSDTLRGLFVLRRTSN